MALRCLRFPLTYQSTPEQLLIYLFKTAAGKGHWNWSKVDEGLCQCLDPKELGLEPDLPRDRPKVEILSSRKPISRVKHEEDQVKKAKDRMGVRDRVQSYSRLAQTRGGLRQVLQEP